jgi:hypothetical protein
MEQLASNQRIVYIAHTVQDSQLPEWARRSHPLVRRELGRYWRTMLPEIGFLRQAIMLQAGFILLTLVFPVLIDLTLPLITAAVVLLPLSAYLYLRALWMIADSVIRSITRDLNSDTFQLIRVTPFDLRTILFSRIAAALWRVIEDLGLVMVSAAFITMPLLMWRYASLWAPDDYPLISRTAMLLGLVVSLLRLWLEPFMIGMMALYMGAALHTRAASLLGTLILTLFYYLLLNGLQFVEMHWVLRFLADFALPLALPLGLITLFYHQTRRLLDD